MKDEAEGVGEVLLVYDTRTCKKIACSCNKYGKIHDEDNRKDDFNL